MSQQGCNHKFVELTCVDQRPPYKASKVAIRSCIIESVAVAKEEHIMVGGATIVYLSGGQAMFVATENYEEIMERIAVAEKEIA